MGFFKSIANFGKKVLGGAVGAGNWMRTLRDKAVSGFNKLKDKLPDFIKAPLDTGIEFLMNSPVGRGIKAASSFLDTATDAGTAALAKLKGNEADTGTPTAAQLQDIGRRAADAQAPGQSEQPDADAQQQARLANLHQE
jgi:hypothetical protein